MVRVVGGGCGVGKKKSMGGNLWDIELLGCENQVLRYSRL